MFIDRITCRTLSIAAIIVVSMPVGTALAQTAGAVVDTQVTELEIQQRSRLNELSTHKAPRLEEVVNELRQEKRRVEDARRLGVDVSDAEVDEHYAKMASRMRLTPEQLTEILERSGMNAATLKHRIRADVTWQRYLQLRRQELQLRWQEPPQQWQEPPLQRQDPPRRDRDDG
jgi:peptidyl-prolyl cis-trans isomerase SurA